MSTTETIWIIPFFGQGHLFPSMELCKHLASLNYQINLIISSHVSSSIPSSIHQHQLQLIQVTEITSSSTPSSPPPPQPPQSGSDPTHHHHNNDMAQKIEELLLLSNTRPVCVVIDVMMSWCKDVFRRANVPIVSFFTSGACSAAMEYAMWEAKLVDVEIKPGEIRLLPGLPDEMALTKSDLLTTNHGPPPPMAGFPGPPSGPPPPRAGFPGPPGGPPPPMTGVPGPSGGPPPPMTGVPGPSGGPPPPMAGFPGPPGGPPKHGERPPWVSDVEGSIAVLINTCNELEQPFIEYLSNRISKPVYGVGPLLPNQFYKSDGSLLHDREIRTNRNSTVTEDEVIQWLDSKPRGSVLYVSFGSEVSPTVQELTQLAQALEESNRYFIWVIQSGPGPGPGRVFHPGSGFDKRVENRGLVIYGWAPQLLILSHGSTGGFLSHCGWNSTVEGLGKGVPLLGWPIRGDQQYNAKLVVKHLKVGSMVCDDLSEMVKKEDIVKGIEKVMGDGSFLKQAQVVKAKFGNGFPESSVVALDAFRDFIREFG